VSIYSIFLIIVIGNKENANFRRGVIYATGVLAIYRRGVLLVPRGKRKDEREPIGDPYVARINAICSKGG